MVTKELLQLLLSDIQEQLTNKRSVDCAGDTEALRREGPPWGQKPLLKATGQASSRDRRRNEATQIPSSMRHTVFATWEISGSRTQLSLPAAKASGQRWAAAQLLKLCSSLPANTI